MKKQAIAKELWQGLSACSHSMGELINRLDLPTQELNNIYLSIRDRNPEPSSDGDSLAANAFTASPFGNNPFGDNPFGSDPFAAAPAETAVVDAPASTAQERVGQDDNFAHQAFKAWVAHLRELPQQAPQWHQLGMNSELINHLSEELITAATRLDLEGTLKRALAGQEQAGTRREHLMARQVLRAQLTMRDFIAWFGYLTLPPEKVPNSYVGEKNKVFLRQKPLMNDELPQLAAVAPQPGVSYLGDWLSALMSVVLDNAGHSATRDISVEHNRQLGQIISQLKQENMPC